MLYNYLYLPMYLELTPATTATNIKVSDVQQPSVKLSAGLD